MTIELARLTVHEPPPSCERAGSLKRRARLVAGSGADSRFMRSAAREVPLALLPVPQWSTKPLSHSLPARTRATTLRVTDGSRADGRRASFDAHVDLSARGRNPRLQAVGTPTTTEYEDAFFGQDLDLPQGDATAGRAS